MLFLGKHVLGRTYIKLLVSLANTSTEICFYNLSNLSLRSEGCNVSAATSMVN